MGKQNGPASPASSSKHIPSFARRSDLSFAPRRLRVPGFGSAAEQEAKIVHETDGLRPDSGELTLDGANLLGDPALRARIGYMPQIGRFPAHLRVGQIFDLMREIRRGTCARIDEDLVRAFQIDRLAHQTAGTLSGGTRQKVSACLAFLFDPDVLVLDEPTAGLDPVSVEALKEKLRTELARGKLILITSHILSDLDEIATDVLYLIEGRMQFYRPIEELKAESGETRLGRVVAQIMLAANGVAARPEEPAP